MIVLIHSDITESQKTYLQQNLKLDLTQTEPATAFYLSFQEDYLRLQKRQSREHGIVVDFLEDQKDYQRQKITVKKDLLAKAIGVEPGLKVCDLTMGLAGDSYKLCYFGASVTAIEENPFLVLLVCDGLRRYEENKNQMDLKICEGSFHTHLPAMVLSHDVFYLDPMYEHERTALPRKEMQYLAEIAQPTPQERLQEVIDTCRATQKKLVVKRAPQSEPICGVKPRRSVDGKMVRFDIYY